MRKGLDFLLINHKSKNKGDGTCAQLRKKAAVDKKLDAKHDTASKRGISTEQCLEIETLDLKRENMADKKNYSVLVGLSVEETALNK